MKKFFWPAAMFSILFGVSSSSLKGISLCSGFAPENDRYIPVGLRDGATGITEAEFNGVLDKIQKVFDPIIQAKGGVLQINRKWDDGTVNAYAEQVGNSYQINMFGGLARYNTMTVDGFMLVACHELGHHLGGKPKMSSFFGGSSWAAVEGQADYFGTAKCMKRMFLSMSSTDLNDFKNDNQTAADTCSKLYSDATDRLICERDTAAGIVLGNILSNLSSTGVVTLETPSTEVYAGIDEKHPKAQCRLDTYFGGSICTVPYSTDFSETNQLTGACTKTAGFTQGLRPVCWFNPSDGQSEPSSSVKAIPFGNREIYY